MIDIDKLEALAKANLQCVSLDDALSFVEATTPANVLALIAEVRKLREDAARLDWLDTMNANLNRHYGTTYQWKVILSPNITRLMTGRQWAGYVGDVDLNDAQCGSDTSASCRDAIDAARGAA